jgi:peptide deformylase
MSILYRLVILMEHAGYKGIDVRSDDKEGSIITLGMRGNKARMVKHQFDRRNAYQRQLDSKNQFTQIHRFY